ncbi:MAG TPA: ABC transporter ATP-binding protein [Bacteroidales bacterium]|nr:ABC transporter ATP-binding protein [Bacteroidales bacterium]
MKKDSVFWFKSLVIGYFENSGKHNLLPPLSASASKGELIAIVGRNGIGKSTLIRTLAGIQTRLQGEIAVRQKDLNEFSINEIARMLGFISTEIVRVSNMSVYELVSLGRYPYSNWIGNLTNSDRNIIMKAIERTSIHELCNRYISELSDGERQKTMIARLIAQDTEFMLMDEPTAFLDVRSKFEILHLMYSLTRQEGKTIIFSTHDLNIALKYSDKVWLVLDNGLYEGAPEDLMIKGKFDKLFDSSTVRFNSEDGSYSFIDSATHEKIMISGNRKNLHWTEEAVKRAGYSPSNEASRLRIEITGNSWILSYPGGEYEYLEIYELVKALSKIPTGGIYDNYR